MEENLNLPVPYQGLRRPLKVGPWTKQHSRYFTADFHLIYKQHISFLKLYSMLLKMQITQCILWSTHTFTLNKNTTSLAVQWLGFCPSTTGCTGSVPVWELRSHRSCILARKGKKPTKKTVLLVSRNAKFLNTVLADRI